MANSAVNVKYFTLINNVINHILPELEKEPNLFE